MNTVPPGLPKDELRHIWDAVAPKYDGCSWIEDHILGVKRLRRRLMQKARGDVLDVACGTGANFPYFAPGCQITAIDLSAGMLAEARNRANKLGKAVNLQVMDAEHLEFPDHSFDTVTTAMATCTIPNPVAALREMGRVCRPDGQILLLEHGKSRWNLVQRYQDFNPRLFFGSGCRWNQDTLELVKIAGLNIVSVRRSLIGILYVIEAKPGLP